MSNAGWVAVKHKSSSFGDWCIAPRKYFETHGRIPDWHADLITPGLDEVSDHTLRATDGSDGRALLEASGFFILENPIWYFDSGFTGGVI